MPARGVINPVTICTVDANGDAVPVGPSAGIPTTPSVGTPALYGTLANGAEVTVGAAATQILAASSTAKLVILQNTSANNVRVGVSGVTATTGFRLAAGVMVIFTPDMIPTTAALYAIREGSSDGTVLAQVAT